MNPYISWDLGALNVLLSYCKSGIGAAVTVGIVIFAITSGIRIVILIVKRFSKV